MLELPATTCRLVAMRPSLATMKPVPSACSVCARRSTASIRAAISAGERKGRAPGDAARGASAMGDAADLGWHPSAPMKQSQMGVDLEMRKGAS